MVLKNFEDKKPSLQELKKVISLLEVKENPLNKFKNTDIYHSLKYNQRILESQSYE